jgi:tetratricopeptide (TPR) repeat protein
MKKLLLCIIPVFLFACAVPLKKEEKPLPQPLSKEEQEKRALEAFNAILEITEKGPRHEILPELEKAYLEIINNYPEAPLAQESYLRLLLIYTKEFVPPKTEEAEKLYREFQMRYPDSPFKKEIENTMVRFYYNHKLWDRLLTSQIPYIKEYIKTGELKTPVHLFYYSEAKFGLGDLKEAEKGFRTIITLFPQSSEAVVSKKRLEDILKGGQQ